MRRWFVYVISEAPSSVEQSVEYCKIGRTVDVQRRALYFATGNPRFLTIEKTWAFGRRDDACAVERTILDIGREFRVSRGEWLTCGVARAVEIVEQAIRQTGVSVE